MIARVLDGAPAELLETYSGAPYQRHFARRRLSRRMLESLQHPLLVELAFGGLRTAAGRKLARRVLFGRGSFPDVDDAPAQPDTRDEPRLHQAAV